jgi:transposase
MDLGDRKSYVHVIDGGGGKATATKVDTTRSGMTAFFGKRKPALVAIEAGTHSPWVYHLLTSFGHEVLVANPLKISLITRNQSKSDRADAKLLAKFAFSDPEHLYPIRHLGQESLAHLQLIRARDLLVRSRTAQINALKGMLKNSGVILKRKEGEKREQFLRVARANAPEELLPVVDIHIATIHALTQQIRDADQKITKLAATTYPVVNTLTQIHGVGILTALTFVLTIEDPKRFRNSRAVGSYFGLVPKRRQSGSSDPRLGITKAGAPLMRRLLVQAAQYILGPFGRPCDLREWGERLIESHRNTGGKRKVVIAVARKLAILLHRLWITGEEYDPHKVRHLVELEAASAV